MFDFELTEQDMKELAACREARHAQTAITNRARTARPLSRAGCKPFEDLVAPTAPRARPR